MSKLIRFVSEIFPNLPAPPPLWVLHFTGVVVVGMTAVNFYILFR